MNIERYFRLQRGSNEISRVLYREEGNMEVFIEEISLYFKDQGNLEMETKQIPQKLLWIFQEKENVENKAKEYIKIFDEEFIL